jgi:hypothetical protein
MIQLLVSIAALLFLPIALLVGAVIQDRLWPERDSR